LTTDSDISYTAAVNANLKYPNPDPIANRNPNHNTRNFNRANQSRKYAKAIAAMPVKYKKNTHYVHLTTIQKCDHCN